MATRSRAPTTDISSPPAFTRCCCSIVKATVWQPNSDPATCTAPTTGKSYCCPRSRGSRNNLGNLWRRLVLPKKNRLLVTDQLAATVGEDGQAVGETCPVLLAPVGRRASDAAGVRCDSPADLGDA